MEEKNNKKISDLTLKDVNHKLHFNVIVKEIYQTSGPTIFTLFDGTQSIKASSFAGPGKRALPNLNKDDVIKAHLLIKQWENTLQAELLSFVLLDNKDEFIRKINDLELNKIQPDVDSFLINSPILEILKPKIKDCARLIKKAIYEGQPILLRHHADADGFSGAIALERAILPIIEQKHGEPSKWRNYRRAPTRIPFYELSDVLKDISFFQSDISRFNSQAPLIILIDNGSSEQDLLGLKKVKLFGAKVIVIDHHMMSEEVSKIVDIHINPYLANGTFKFTAGMISSEIARFINKDFNDVELFASVAGIGDKSDIEEFDKYLNLSKEKGFEFDKLLKIAEVIDFEAYFLSFMESRELINEIFFGKNHEKIIDLIYPIIDEKKENQIIASKHYAKINKKDDITLVELDIQETSYYGGFPPSGKITGLIFQNLKEEYPKLIVLGIIDGMIIIRMQGLNINLGDIIVSLKHKFPYAMINGGGHEVAGTIKCINAAKEEILSELKNLLN